MKAKNTLDVVCAKTSRKRCESQLAAPITVKWEKRWKASLLWEVRTKERARSKGVRWPA